MAGRESAGRDEDAAVPGERELLALVARRDRRAFTELYRRYQPRLLAYLYRLLSNAALADEIVDDVLFVVWQDAKKFRGTSAVSSWIFGIAYRKSMTALRRELRYQKPLDRDADIGRLPALSRADTEFVHAGLTALSADHRQVVELTYFCGFSYQEIAEIADCPVNTVKTRMFHARRRLKTLLPELAGDAVKPGREHG
jgi:RNA polymerase sigma-70 factor (ECF subfamily)